VMVETRLHVDEAHVRKRLPSLDWNVVQILGEVSAPRDVEGAIGHAFELAAIFRLSWATRICFSSKRESSRLREIGRLPASRV